MTEQELKDAVAQAKQQFNDAVDAARQANITVNLWIKTSGPLTPVSSHLDCDFGA